MHFFFEEAKGSWNVQEQDPVTMFLESIEQSKDDDLQLLVLFFFNHLMDSEKVHTMNPLCEEFF